MTRPYTLPPLPQRAIELLDVLRHLARREAPLPSLMGLAQLAGHPSDSVPISLKCLEKRGLIKIERGAAIQFRRILVVNARRWTGWSQPPLPPGRKPREAAAVASAPVPPPPPPVVSKPVIVGGYQGQRYEDDPHFATLGRTGRPIIGRPGAGFIAREASC